METPRPAWSEEELPQPLIKEREVSPESVIEKSQALSFAEGELVAEAIKKQPIVAFEHVSKAAEADQPVEKKYETRHELKDEPAAQQAVSIGSVIAAMPSQPSRQSAQVEPSVQQQFSAPTTPAAQQQPPKARPTLYSQAIRAGFVVAIMLIVFFMLLIVII